MDTMRRKDKIKVTFYMKSGNIITMRFEEFEITGQWDNIKITYKGEKDFSIDLRELECVVVDEEESKPYVPPLEI